MTKAFHGNPMKILVAMATRNSHRHNSFSFDRIYLKLADKLDMDGISDTFENWPHRIITLRITFS